MKKLNKQSAVIFNKIIQQLNGSDHIIIDNSEGTFMSLYVEKLYDVKNFIGYPGTVYSMSHYFEQNGDLVPDPDMTFLFVNDDTIYPLTFQDQYGYQRGLWNDEGKWMINKKVQDDMVNFGNMWLKNLKEQQNLV
ncbi:MAG: hypothetical protein PHP52_14255 [Bacteroidales bacterium]|jgi:hypothetical protein|nr:hypothetical protein [Bacteroidales bacterium]